MQSGYGAEAVDLDIGPPRGGLTQPLFYLLIGSLVTAALFVCYVSSNLIVTTVLLNSEMIKGNPVSFLAVYTLLFSLGMLFLMPFTPFCIVCGFIYGMWDGIWVQVFCISVSSALIFYCVSYTGKAQIRDSLKHRCEKYVIALEKIQGDRWKNAQLNFILCLIPMPYGVHVYIFALFDSPFTLFLFPFQAGMLLHVLCNLFIGSSLALNLNNATVEKGHSADLLLSFVFLTLSLCSVVMVQKMLAAQLSVLVEADEQGA